MPTMSSQNGNIFQSTVTSHTKTQIQNIVFNQQLITWNNTSKVKNKNVIFKHCILPTDNGSEDMQALPNGITFISSVCMFIILKMVCILSRKECKPCNFSQDLCLEKHHKIMCCDVFFPGAHEWQWQDDDVWHQQSWGGWQRNAPEEWVTSTDPSWPDHLARSGSVSSFQVVKVIF